MNKIVIYFNLCSPAPVAGYKVYYRVAGTSDVYTYAGSFFNSPAIFYDTLNPAGTCYEGYIVSDCGNDILGNHILWVSCESGESGESGGSDQSSCGTTISITTSSPAYTNLGYFDLHVDGVITVNLFWSSYDRPNRFNLYEDGVLIQTTGWKGYAPYPGPWGLSLSTSESGTITFNPVPGKEYKVSIEAGNAGPSPYDGEDSFELNINCGS